MTYTDNPFLARTQQEPAGQGESHEERIAVCEAYVDAGQAREEGGNPFKPKVLFTPFGKILRTISGNVVSRKNTQISRKNTLVSTHYLALTTFSGLFCFFDVHSI